MNCIDADTLRCAYSGLTGSLPAPKITGHTGDVTLNPLGTPAADQPGNPAPILAIGGGGRPFAIPPDNAGRADPESAICSAKKCREAARWAVVWNNPKIHTPDREKVWTACDDHRTTLADYLTAHRMTLLRVDPLGAASPGTQR